MLFQHQIDTCKWMKQIEDTPRGDGTTGGVVCLKMGLGKTLVFLYHHINNTPIYGKGLVVVSKSVMVEWERNINQFYPDLDVVYITKTTHDILSAKLVVITYDILIRMDDSFFDHEWYRIVCDESQRFTNPNTKLFKTIIRIKSKYRWCLSGTPMKNYNTDAWSHLRFLGYTKVTAKEWSRIGLKVWKDRQFEDLFYIINYDQTDIVLPECKERTIYTDMSDNQKSIYTEKEKRLRKLYGMYINNEAVDYIDILSMISLLRQITISPTLLYPGFTEISSKVTKVLEIIAKHPNEKIIVFSSFKKSLKYTSSFLPVSYIQIDGDTTDRKNALDQFRQSDIRIALLTYKVGSEGLNLIEAGVCIMLEPWWCPAVIEQAKSRIWRIGQTRETYVYHLLVKDSIEMKIAKISVKKEGMIKSFLKNLI